MLSTKQQVILKLIRQHRGLQKSLGLISRTTKSAGASKYLIITHMLADFKNDLLEHVTLEKVKFYDVLITNEEIGKEKAIEFMNSMKAIGEAVMEFLTEYSDEKYLQEHFSDFKNELVLVTSKLNNRISLEEAGVYSYWAIAS